MRYEMMRSRGAEDEWRVEAIDYEHDGQVSVAIFSGPDAERRAKEYMEWRNATRGVAREAMPAHAEEGGRYEVGSKGLCSDGTGSSSGNSSY